MRYRTEEPKIGLVELTYLLIGLLLMLFLGVVAQGQRPTPGTKAVKAHSQIQQPGNVEAAKGLTYVQ